MPEYLAPGVYVEEVSSGIKPIEGVGTSTGAFVGRARKGPIGQAQLITNATQFTTVFGNLHPDYFLGYGVANFFTEGGTRCYVVRIAKDNADISTAPLAQDVTVSATSKGKWGDNISFRVDTADANDATVTANSFRLIVFYRKDGAPAVNEREDVVEVFNRLSMQASLPSGAPNPLYIERQINGRSAYITVDDAADNGQPPAAVPVQNLAGGDDGNAPDNANDFIGTEANRKGLHALDPIDDINIVAIPDLFNPSLALNGRDATLQAINYCELRKDCFFIADSPSGLDIKGIREYKQGQGGFNGQAFTSTFAALYYPWIKMSDPLSGQLIDFPPSCSVAGIYSATDVSRGVHKAPAGVVEGRVKTAAGIEREVTKGEQDTLNPKGINVIRKFPDAGIVVWGARTVTTDQEWKYINVRRLFLFIEESIDEGTQWVVFEPNDPVLWARIVRNVSAFLRIQWHEGKLVGLKESQAFFVKCDAETNPPESVDQGRVITEIGIAPSKPAEFVIFRITQKASELVA